MSNSCSLNWNSPHKKRILPTFQMHQLCTDFAMSMITISLTTLTHLECQQTQAGKYAGLCFTMLPCHTAQCTSTISLCNLFRCIHFEGSLFKGKAMLWTKGVGSQPAGLFKGQRRKSSITVQGRFTRPTVMSHLVSGPEFSRAFVNLPAKWFVEGVLMKVTLCMPCSCRSLTRTSQQAELKHACAHIAACASVNCHYCTKLTACRKQHSRPGIVCLQPVLAAKVHDT